MKIMFNDLSKQWEVIKNDVAPRFNSLFEKSDFIGGKAIEQLEENFAKYCGIKYGIGVSNGTDALKISLASLDLESPCGVI
ncbi:MAG: DegT/DnrJ/EryC1/StrS family aminotransferase, partial [Candidatus Hodarchaeota archaeon]